MLSENDGLFETEPSFRSGNESECGKFIMNYSYLKCPFRYLTR